MKNRLDITRYEYITDKISDNFDGFKIVMMSDLHSCQVGRGNSLLIDVIDEINPDIILCAGDMVTSDTKNINVTKNLFEELCMRYKIYYAIGNHEQQLKINPRSYKLYMKYCRHLRELGVTFLNNKTRRIVKDNDFIRISGLNINRAYYHKMWHRVNMPHDYIKSLIGKANPDKLNILLAHNPEYHRQYAAWGADIVLSGHIHGGMVVLPVIGGVIAPSFMPFPHYDFGEFVENNSTMYLSRGLGWHSLPIRWFNPPELLCITLRRP